MSRYAGLLGIIVFLSIAYLFSTNRRAIRLKTVLWGLGLQFVFAWIVVRYSWGQAVMSAAGEKVKKLLAYSFVGSSFVFGDLGSILRTWAFSLPFRYCPPSSLFRHFLHCSITWA